MQNGRRRSSCAPCDLKKNGPKTIPIKPDRCADARSRWAREPRTASGILPRVVWCIRCLLPLLPQPSAALLSQMATHAVRPPFTGDPRHDDNIPFGGRGPLHGRRSRGVGNRVHSTPARAPLSSYRQRPSPCIPLLTIMRPRSHRRSYFGWAPSSMRSRSMCPTGTGTCS